MGQALRAFQPTIREVVEVSQDLKGTLEKVMLGQHSCRALTARHVLHGTRLKNIDHSHVAAVTYMTAWRYPYLDMVFHIRHNG